VLVLGAACGCFDACTARHSTTFQPCPNCFTLCRQLVGSGYQDGNIPVSVVPWPLHFIHFPPKHVAWWREYSWYPQAPVWSSISYEAQDPSQSGEYCLVQGLAFTGCSLEPTQPPNTPTLPSLIYLATLVTQPNKPHKLPIHMGRAEHPLKFMHALRNLRHSCPAPKMAGQLGSGVPAAVLFLHDLETQVQPFVHPPKSPVTSRCRAAHIRAVMPRRHTGVACNSHSISF